MWTPIDTAPKNVPCLVKVATGDMATAMQQDCDNGKGGIRSCFFIVEPFHFGGYDFASNDDGAKKLIIPTHWYDFEAQKNLLKDASIMIKDLRSRLQSMSLTEFRFKASTEKLIEEAQALTMIIDGRIGE